MEHEFTTKQENELMLQYTDNQIPTWSLYCFDKQTPEICMAAVRNNGNTLKFVYEQTYEICLEAIKQNRDALQFVRDKDLFNKLKSEFNID